jgi:hypothetical protein
LGVNGPFLLKSAGYQGLKAVRANTAFLGTVLTPFGEDGLRLAIDFSRIRKIGDVLTPSPDLVLAHEDFWPERVTRAPLTDADRARGYTAGCRRLNVNDQAPRNVGAMSIQERAQVGVGSRLKSGGGEPKRQQPLRFVINVDDMHEGVCVPRLVLPPDGSAE